MDASLGDANDLTSSQLHLLGEETLARQDHDTEHAHRTLTLWNTFSLLVLTQIGAGLFASPTTVNANVPSPGVALFAWLFACILGWTGAASFADLAFLFPNGGMEDYLHRFYGDTLSFLMAWTWITIVKPSSMAMVSTVLLESILAGLDSNVAPWAKRLFTMLAFFVIVVVNLHSTQTSKRVSNFFLVIKLTTVAIIVVLGSFAALLGRASPFTDWLTKPWLETRPSIIGEDRIDWAQLNWWQVVGHFCTALYAVLWACSGWDNASFVAREMHNASKDLPRAIHSSMALVTMCYQLVNISFYILVSWDSFGTSRSVAVTAAGNLLGPFGAVLIAILISLVAAGTVSANVFIISRLTVSASNKGHIPAIFAWRVSSDQQIAFIGRVRDALPTFFRIGAQQRQPSYVPISAEDHNWTGSVGSLMPTYTSSAEPGVPLLAMILNFILTSLYIWFGSFKILITFNGTAVYTFYFLTLLGLVSYRVKELQMKSSPVQQSFFVIIPPAVFCVVSFVILLRTLVFLPAQAASLAGLMCTGVLIRNCELRRAMR